MRLEVAKRFSIFYAAAVLLAAAGGGHAQVGDSKSQFQKETDPVRKARLLPRLGETQLDMVRDHAQRGDIDAALAVLQEYREAVASAHEALKSSGINAEKKPSGFKQLEIHLRRSLRRLEDVIVAVPFERRGDFEAVRKRLEEVDRDLLIQLFPRRPDKKRKD